MESQLTVPKCNRPGKPPRDKIIPVEILIDMYCRQKMSHTEIAQTLGITQQTVSARLKRAGIEHLEMFKKHRADVLAAKQNEILSAITVNDIKDAGLRDKVVAAGILFDKERLQRGEATEIVDHAGVSKELAEIEAKLKEYEERERSTINITPQPIVDASSCND